jgi:hypothetical protein
MPSLFIISSQCKKLQAARKFLAAFLFINFFNFISYCYTVVMKKSKAIAVFDISSSSVGGAHALVEQQKDNRTKVTLLVQERRDSGLGDELTIDRFVEDTAKALEVVIDHVRTADVHHPSLIQVVLASPWYSTHSRTITYNKTTSFTCTKRLVDELIEKEIIYLLKQDTDTGETFGSGFRVVEQQLSHISLNGYETIEPYGKKAQSLEVVLTITLVPEVVVERFTSIIRRSYGDRTINVTTGPYAAYVALRDNGGVASDCVIIDIGEEVTDVAFVKNNNFLYQHSFPVGTYELYRSLSTTTGSMAEARSYLEAFRLQKLHAAQIKEVKKAVTTFSSSWQKAFIEVVEAGQYGFKFPSECYVVAHPRFQEIFTSLITDDEYLTQSAGVDHIRVMFVDPLHTSAAVTVSSTEQPDTSLAMAALFAERLLY